MRKTNEKEMPSRNGEPGAKTRAEGELKEEPKKKWIKQKRGALTVRKDENVPGQNAGIKEKTQEKHAHTEEKKDGLQQCRHASHEVSVDNGGVDIVI